MEIVRLRVSETSIKDMENDNLLLLLIFLFCFFLHYFFFVSCFCRLVLVVVVDPRLLSLYEQACKKQKKNWNKCKKLHPMYKMIIISKKFTPFLLSVSLPQSHFKTFFYLDVKERKPHKSD